MKTKDLCTGRWLPLAFIVLLVACDAHTRHAAGGRPHEPAVQAEGERLHGPGMERRPLPVPMHEKHLVSIKVLASDGQWETAQASARRLSAGGYPSTRLDVAEKRFDGTRVYFADGFEDHAQAIADALGREAVSVRPLTWRSIFHVIVVTDTPP